VQVNLLPLVGLAALLLWPGTPRHRALLALSLLPAVLTGLLALTQLRGFT